MLDIDGSIHIYAEGSNKCSLTYPEVLAAFQRLTKALRLNPHRTTWGTFEIKFLTVWAYANDLIHAITKVNQSPVFEFSDMATKPGVTTWDKTRRLPNGKKPHRKFEIKAYSPVGLFTLELKGVPSYLEARYGLPRLRKLSDVMMALQSPEGLDMAFRQALRKVASKIKTKDANGDAMVTNLLAHMDRTEFAPNIVIPSHNAASTIIVEQNPLPFPRSELNLPTLMVEENTSTDQSQSKFETMEVETRKITLDEERYYELFEVEQENEHLKIIIQELNLKLKDRDNTIRNQKEILDEQFDSFLEEIHN